MNYVIRVTKGQDLKKKMQNFNRKYASYIEYVNPKTDDKTEK